MYFGTSVKAKPRCRQKCGLLQDFHGGVYVVVSIDGAIHMLVRPYSKKLKACNE